MRKGEAPEGVDKYEAHMKETEIPGRKPALEVEQDATNGLRL